VTVSDLPPLNLEPFPPIDLRHMLTLTDDTAMLQHATCATPDLWHGYCTDDNARALLAAVKLWALPRDTWSSPRRAAPSPDKLLTAMHRYLAFLSYALNPAMGRFRNFMQYDRTWREQVGSEDSHARTVWALGETVRRAPTADIRQLAEQLLQRALPALDKFGHLRPWAYALLGLEEYLRCENGHETAGRLREALAGRLLQVRLEHATKDWPWWEDCLTWGNAKLPHALLVAGRSLGREDMVSAALESLCWLLDVQTGEDGQVSIVGNQGWYFRGRPRARYDQQPIEAKGLVQACLAAAEATGEARWAEEAVRCFQWFTGRNDAGVPLYNPRTGGCRDGLMAAGVNANQGAESTVAYVLTVLELHHYRLGGRCTAVAADEDD